MMRMAQQKEEQWADEKGHDGNGAGDDSPGTRDIRELLLAAVAISSELRRWRSVLTTTSGTREALQKSNSKIKQCQFPGTR